jgi:transcriptional regulator with XRE-family HTH domain
MTTIHQRIKECREKLGYSKNAFAKMIGISREAVGQWEQDPPRGTKPQGENLYLCAKYLKTTPEYLLYGSKEVDGFSTIRTKRVSFYAWQNIVSSTTLADLQNLKKEIFTMQTHDDVEDDLLENAFGFAVKGDSMIAPNANPKTLYEGDVAIVTPRLKPKSGDTVLASTSAGKMLRVFHDNGNEQLLVALNESYPRLYVDKNTDIWGVLYRSYRNQVA